MDGRLVVIGGKRWRLRYASPSTNGECDPPETPQKQIRLHKRLRRYPVARTETIIHEVLHASAWMLDEALVHQYAEDVTRILEAEGCLNTP